MELVELYSASRDRALTYEQLLFLAGDDEMNEFGLTWSFTTVAGRGLDSNLPDVELYAGRHLTPSDEGAW
ncbi:MAG: hypothetical protein R6W48_12765, partial [Gaiellaceae bacterium]